MRSLAAVIESAALIGTDEDDSAGWARDLRLGAKACEALRCHRENLRGATTLRRLAGELRISMTDLCAIIDDGGTIGQKPDFIRKRENPS